MQRTLYFNFNENTTTWQTVPDSLWRSLLQDYFLIDNDFFGLKGLSSVEDVHTFGILQDFPMEPAGKSSYQPYCIPASVKNVDEYSESVLLFPFDEQAMKALSHISLGELYPDNEFIPTEEIVFFRDGKILATASNIDNHIRFYSLTYRDLKLLTSYGPGVRRGLLEN